MLVFELSQTVSKYKFIRKFKNQSHDKELNQVSEIMSYQKFSGEYAISLNSFVLQAQKMENTELCGSYVAKGILIKNFWMITPSKNSGWVIKIND